MTEHASTHLMRWHWAATWLLLVFGGLGFELLVPLLLLIPGVLCFRAGRSWGRGDPDAGAKLRTAHTVALCVTALLAVLCGFFALSTGLAIRGGARGGMFISIEAVFGICLAAFVGLLLAASVSVAILRHIGGAAEASRLALFLVLLLVMVLGLAYALSYAPSS